MFYIAEMQTITLRTDGRSREKRDITIVDNSGISIEITLWGHHVYSIERENINLSNIVIVLIESTTTRLLEYNDKKFRGN